MSLARVEVGGVEVDVREAEVIEAAQAEGTDLLVEAGTGSRTASGPSYRWSCASSPPTLELRCAAS